MKVSQNMELEKYPQNQGKLVNIYLTVKDLQNPHN